MELRLIPLVTKFNNPFTSMMSSIWWVIISPNVKGSREIKVIISPSLRSVGSTWAMIMMSPEENLGAIESERTTYADTPNIEFA